MLGLIAFCFFWFTCAFAAAGATKLFIFLIQPGQLFQGWNKVLMLLEPVKGERHYWSKVLLSKRLGDCYVCTQQFVAEISFLVFVVLFNSWPTEAIDVIWLKWLVNILIFAGYCGTVMAIGVLINPVPKTQTNNETIIESDGM